ncbi:Rv1733c family protein [Nocardia arthritidis]|uniref:Uncharacterized protein n=1 Tax=Nocardia arthritidis TaxID=228602 RepID=A0A6G9YFV9_9NOCA|nr:hypothetical protein [Nocardia arthritidis]QIS12092.1 hypothetical protein F5544_21145 [Nocardia arthritidis]
MSGSTGVLRRTCRWAGLDRNPMRRREDRLQSACAIALLVLFLAAAPLLAVLLGGRVYRSENAAVQAEFASLHEVSATVLETGKAPLYSPITPVKVAWKDADGSEHTAAYSSTKIVKPGATLNIWLNGAGNVVEPPADSRAASKAVLVTSGAVFGVLIGCVACYLGLRYSLDRRRLRQWETDWITADLLWGNHS